MKAVFIAGCARSGTTLLGSMLGSSPVCLATPEAKFNLEVYRDCLRAGRQGDMSEALRRIMGHWSFKIWGVAVEPEQARQAGGCASYGELITWLVRRYGDRLGRPAPERWIDHTPLNVLHASTLFELFPEARMLHIVRDGRGVAASVMRLDWGPNTSDAAAHWWVRRVAHGLAAEHHFGPERVMRVSYEGLVREPRATLQAICAFLELEYQEAMIGGTGFRPPSYSAGQHALIGGGPRAGRASAWRTELSPRQIELFESIAGEMLGCLGYEPLYGLGARPGSRLERLRSAVEELYLARVVNRFRFQRRVLRSAVSDYQVSETRATPR
ncbi:MAG: sulfotransferase [Chloroflexales bacterium]|nr:sulfotransferase [Chloroflexales bacterium]